MSERQSESEIKKNLPLKRFVVELTLWATKDKIDLDTYPLRYSFLVGLFLFFALATTFGLGVREFYRGASFILSLSPTGQGANVNDGTNDSGDGIPSSEGEKLVASNILDGSWEVWLGDIKLENKEDNSILRLPANEDRGVLKHQKKLPPFTNFKVRFAALGTNAINFSFLVNDLYEIVLGDNDYRTLSFKATKSVNSPQRLIQEKAQKTTRPSLSEQIKKGTNLIMETFVRQLQDESIQIDINVSYIGLTDEIHVDTFTYQFLPAITNEDLRTIGIGLIRGKDDPDEIAVSILEPEVVFAEE